ncbi:MAG TPA: metal-dependent hydrolase [Nitrospiria bacterium]|nr:metal-dependent hydrolase [Nitrospiria bacterium]
MRRIHFIFSVLIAALILPFNAAFAGQTTITFHGHAAFEIRTPGGKVLWIDPWLKNPLNPAARDNADPLAGISKADYILLTHGHFDHVGDSVALAKKTGARLVGSFELGSALARLQGYPKEQMGFDSLFNIGGEITIADGEVVVQMTPAVHSSGVKNPKAASDQPDVVYGGNPGGFILKIKDGPTIYHTGDTAFFSDMEVIGKRTRPDLALINIGGHFGMEPDMAAEAAAAVRARLVVPHHFGTFPVLTPNTDGFSAALKKKRIPLRILEPGASIMFEGKKPSR